MFSLQINSCFTLISLLAVIRARTHLTFSLVFGDMAIMLNTGFGALSWSHSTRICLPGHLQSSPVFLKTIGYDIVPQRESEAGKSRHCTHLLLLILLNHAVVPQAHNQISSHMDQSLCLFRKLCLMSPNLFMSPPLKSRKVSIGSSFFLHLAIHRVEYIL